MTLVGWVARHRRAGAWALLSTFAFVGAQLAAPFFLKDALDRGLRANDPDALRRASLLLLCAAVFGAVALRARLRFATRFGEGLLYDLRVQVFERLLRLPLAHHERARAGDSVSRLTSDVDALSTFLQEGLVEIFGALLLLLGSLLILFGLSPLLAALCLAVVLPLALLASRFNRLAKERYATVRAQEGATLGALEEGISSAREIRAFGRATEAVGRFQLENEKLREGQLNSMRLRIRFFPILEAGGIATTALVIAAGGPLAQQGAVTVGTLAAFALYLGNLFDPLERLSRMLDVYRSARAAFLRLSEVMALPLEVEEPAEALPLPPRGELSVVDVEFGYGESPVLSGLSLTIPSGEHLALVGETGAGKSTLVKLLARFADPVRGQVLFGGIDLRQASREDLRRRIIFVPQEGYLFRGSVRDNVRLGRPGATDAEVDLALQQVGAHQRFSALPDGLSTEIENDGKLSAGERQLLALARVALADPAVLLLDEASSNLDPASARAVSAALRKLGSGRTVVTVTHRLSQAATADRVAVLANGRLVEQGRSETLLAGEGEFARLHRSLG